MKFLKPSEISELENEALTSYGVTKDEMNSFSAYFLAKFIKSTKAKNIVILSGAGKKGEIGIRTMQHILSFGLETSVFLFGRDATKKERNVSKKLFTDVGVLDEKLKTCDLIVDCLIGIEEKSDPQIADLIKKINSTTIPTISADIPSGYDAENGKPTLNCVNSDEVLCFGAPKFGLDKLNCGIYLSYAGIPLEIAKNYNIYNNSTGLQLIK